MKRFKAVLAVLILSLFLNACAASYGALSTPRQVDNPPPSTLANLSVSGAFTAEAYQQGEIGLMSPVFITLRNETAIPRIISLRQLVAVSDDKKKVIPLPAEEAARQAGEAKAIPGMWQGAATGAGIGAVIGTLGGALIGLALGVPLRGAVLGAGVGGASGGFTGAQYGLQAGSLNSQAQVLSMHLKDQVIHPASEITGYVFFPKGSYGQISVVLSSDEHGQEQLTIPITQSPAVEDENREEQEQED